ncbi:hypothetical protein [Cryobacterium roopkundense]|uniref:Tetratricopeptide (TPR) repeat protein n=1 Tax=Cryobacterium roopkundense TaxID=1001240 RepID=A0A7W8ZZI7_9MICO|nr:hypothetical protein [Cryobacterium roopkundense]MBB5642845.1 tetratricopeptide (TPR) repeat protein [Cryobacterium roopkundense]
MSASEEAVAECRRLAAVDPSTEPNLALALTRLSNRLSAALSPRKALVVAEEAVRIYQRLADMHPDLDDSALARALNVLALRLVEVGRRDKALFESQRSVSMRRMRVDALGDAPEGDQGQVDAHTDLADSLETLAHCWREYGNEQDARHAAREADGLRARVRELRSDHF